MLLLDNSQKIEPAIVVEMKDPMKIKLFRKKLNLDSFNVNDPYSIYFMFKDFSPEITKKDLNKLIKADSDYKNTTRICKIYKNKGQYKLSVYIVPTEGVEKVEYAKDFSQSDEITFKKGWFYTSKKSLPQTKNDDIYVVNGEVVKVDKNYEQNFTRRFKNARKVTISEKGIELNLKNIKVGDKLTVFYEGNVKNFITITEENGEQLTGKLEYTKEGQDKIIKLSKNTIYLNNPNKVKVEKPIKSLEEFLKFTIYRCSGRPVVIKTKKAHENLYKKQQLIEALKDDVKEDVLKNSDLPTLNKLHKIFKNN